LSMCGPTSFPASRGSCLTYTVGRVASLYPEETADEVRNIIETYTNPWSLPQSPELQSSPLISFYLALYY